MDLCRSNGVDEPVRYRIYELIGQFSVNLTYGRYLGFRWQPSNTSYVLYPIPLIAFHVAHVVY